MEILSYLHFFLCLKIHKSAFNYLQKYAIKVFNHNFIESLYINNIRIDILKTNNYIPLSI